MDSSTQPKVQEPQAQEPQAQEPQVPALQGQELQVHGHQILALQGLESNQDEPSQDAPEGGEHQRQDLQQLEVIPPSIGFQSLPLEIQMAIFKEALQKPAVHFIFVDRIIVNGQWSVKFYPVPKSIDYSGYRRLQQLSTVCAAAYAATKWATVESHSIPFDTLCNKVDAATDLFVMRFHRHRGQSHHYVGLRDCFWNPMNEIIPPRFNRDHAMDRFRHMRKVAITYKLTHPARDDPSAVVPFRCLLGHAHPSLNWICPVELAGFMDCFPDLDTFYIVQYTRYQTHRATRVEIDQYRDIMIGPPANRRRNPAVEVFHDTRNTYIEAILPYCLRLWGVGQLYSILREALTHLRRGNMWRMPLEQRRRIKVKVLLQLPKDLALPWQ